MEERADQLREEVAEIMAASSFSSLHARLHMIDTLESLCLDHLFEQEIDDALQQVVAADVRIVILGPLLFGFVYFGNIDTWFHQVINYSTIYKPTTIHPR